MIALLTARKLIQYSQPDPFSECVLWNGARNDRGYGYIWVPKRELSMHPQMARVHRVAYWVFRGPFDLGLVVDHRCHRKLCINPYHLEVETRETNNHEAYGLVEHGLDWSDWEEWSAENPF